MTKEKSPRMKYLDELARKRGYKSYTDLQNALAIKKGYSSHAEYLKDWAAQKGTTLHEYQKKKIEERINKKFDKLEQKADKIKESITEPVSLKEILNYINQGIEIAGWFKDFMFINMHNRGFIVGKIHYGVDADAQWSKILEENEGYQLAYYETLYELGNVINVIESEYNQNVNLYVYNKKELNDMSERLMHEYLRNPLELSTIIIKGCDNFWIQLFLEGKIYETSYSSDGSHLSRWNYDIRELAMHKSLDECVDHMLTWFGA